MTDEFFYLIGTLAFWVGIFYLVRSAVTGIRVLLGAGGSDPLAARRRSLTSLGIGVSLFALSRIIPMPLGRVGIEGLTMPIIWPYAPLPGWILMLGGFAAISRFVSSLSAITPAEERSKRVQSVVWIIVAGLGFWWLHAMQGKIWILRGQFPLHIQIVFTLVVLGILAVVAMVAIEKNTRQRGILQQFSTHLMLLAGCVIFGIPFAWLVITSLKEERDIANTEGLVWTPQVQLTHTWDDPKNPLIETRLEGRVVQARVDTDLGGGKILVEIERPYGMRGRRYETSQSDVKKIPRHPLIWEAPYNGQTVQGFTVEDQPNGDRLLEIVSPQSLKSQRFLAKADSMEPVRAPGLRWENYTEAMEWMPFETWYGVRYLINTLWLVFMSAIGAVLSCSLVAYGFARLRFPGRDQIFTIMLATMMLPAAVTMLPQFLVFRWLGWIDTMLPLWVPTFFASAFNVFLLKQFFSTIPLELEEAARIDGAGYWRTFWNVMLPQVKPALAVIGIWTFMGAWNNFMGPLIYLSSPEKMPLSYALQLFSADRGLEPGLMMAFATMTVVPVVLLFFFAQRYFIEGVQLSGLGGR